MLAELVPSNWFPQELHLSGSVVVLPSFWTSGMNNAIASLHTCEVSSCLWFFPAWFCRIRDHVVFLGCCSGCWLWTWRSCIIKTRRSMNLGSDTNFKKVWKKCQQVNYDSPSLWITVLQTLRNLAQVMLGLRYAWLNSAFLNHHSETAVHSVQVHGADHRDSNVDRLVINKFPCISTYIYFALYYLKPILPEYVSSLLSWYTSGLILSCKD